MDIEPLNDTETRAWRSSVMMWQEGLPRFDRTSRQHGLIHIEDGIMAVLAEQRGGRCLPVIWPTWLVSRRAG